MRNIPFTKTQVESLFQPFTSSGHHPNRATRRQKPPRLFNNRRSISIQMRQSDRQIVRDGSGEIMKVIQHKPN